eukprot:scaffold40008_cov50-Phaeocystis_antarctica.AAC.2
MASMFVTLDVSKLSGWLNAVASCRKEGMRCGARCGPDAGVRRTAAAQARLVERVRTLPSQKEGIRCGARCGPGGGQGVGRWRRKRLARGGPDSRLGVRARAERT